MGVSSSGGFRDRIPMPPALSGRSDIVQIEMQNLSNWLRDLWNAFNAEPRMSFFSGTSPNLSRITGTPGDILVNIASNSTNTLTWQMTGSTSSTSGWRPFNTTTQI